MWVLEPCAAIPTYSVTASYRNSRPTLSATSFSVMKRCTSAKPEPNGSGSSGSIVRDNETARPVRILDAAATLTSSVMRLSVPVRSSSPQRPQFDKDVRYASIPAVVSPISSVVLSACVLEIPQCHAPRKAERPIPHAVAQAQPPSHPQLRSNFANCRYPPEQC